MNETRPTRHQTDLAELLELLLEKGVVVNADIVVSIGDTELLGVKVRAAVASFETAAKYGLEFPEGTDTERLERAAGIEDGEQATIGDLDELHNLGPGTPGEGDDDGPTSKLFDSDDSADDETESGSEELEEVEVDAAPDDVGAEDVDWEDVESEEAEAEVDEAKAESEMEEEVEEAEAESDDEEAEEMEEETEEAEVEDEEAEEMEEETEEAEVEDEEAEEMEEEPEEAEVEDEEAEEMEEEAEEAEVEDEEAEEMEEEAEEAEDDGTTDAPEISSTARVSSDGKFLQTAPSPGGDHDEN